MIPLGYADNANVGPATLACGWLFAGLALGTTGLMMWARSILRRSLASDDYILVAANVLALILTIQTTWAIVDEGQGKHTLGMPRTTIILVVKVSCFL